MAMGGERWTVGGGDERQRRLAKDEVERKD